jgi:hypothetical protein
MGAWGRQFNVTQPFSANLGFGHFHAAPVTYDPLIAHPFIFTAVTLPIPGRPEYSLAKQTVPLRLQRPVIDRLRFFDFSAGPSPDLVGGSKTDAYSVKMIDIQQ